MFRKQTACFLFSIVSPKFT